MTRRVSAFVLAAVCAVACGDRESDNVPEVALRQAALSFPVAASAKRELMFVIDGSNAMGGSCSIQCNTVFTPFPQLAPGECGRICTTDDAF
jgi:hypothetical protein